MELAERVGRSNEHFFTLLCMHVVARASYVPPRLGRRSPISRIVIETDPRGPGTSAEVVLMGTGPRERLPGFFRITTYIYCGGEDSGVVWADVDVVFVIGLRGVVADEAFTCGIGATV